MAGVAKWLRQRIVIPPCGGSSPLARPVPSERPARSSWIGLFIGQTARICPKSQAFGHPSKPKPPPVRQWRRWESGLKSGAQSRLKSRFRADWGPIGSCISGAFRSPGSWRPRQPGQSLIRQFPPASLATERASWARLTRPAELLSCGVSTARPTLTVMKGDPLGAEMAELAVVGAKVIEIEQEQADRQFGLEGFG